MDDLRLIDPNYNPMDFHPTLLSILDMVAMGASIKEVCNKHEIDSKTLAAYLAKVPNFQRAFQDARDLGLEYLADSLLTAHKDFHDIEDAKLFSQNVKWILSKRKSETYGDKVAVDHTVSIDLVAAMKEARLRVVTPVIESDGSEMYL